MSEELRKAIQDLLGKFHIGDYVYDVRERASGDPTHRGNSWEHPDVKRYSECCDILKRYSA